MKKSDEFERLEEVREKVTKILIENMNLKDCVEDVSEISVTVRSNNIYDFVFSLYIAITDMIFYRCVYFADLEELHIYEYDRTESDYFERTIDESE